MNNNEYILELITETNKKLKEVSIKINLELPQDKHPTDEEICFDYTRQASQYLMNNGFVRAKKIDSISNRITLSIEKDAVFYKKFKAEFID